MAIYIKKTMDMAAFKRVRIPSSRELFERYGFSRAVTGHPDNTDPNHWNIPGNLAGQTVQQTLQQGGRIADRYLEAARQAEIQKSAPPEDLPAGDETPKE